SRRRHTRFSRDWSSDVCSSDLAFPMQVWHEGFHKLQKPRSMPGTENRFVARGAKLLDGKVANRGQHAKPGLPIDIVIESRQQRLIVNRLEQLLDLAIGRCAHHPRSFERERIDENAKLTQQPPLVFGEEVVAPDNCA